MLCISIIQSCKKNILLKYTSIQKKIVHLRLQLC